jgi:hypothetical protein
MREKAIAAFVGGLPYLMRFPRDFRPGMQGFIPLSFDASLNPSASFAHPSVRKGCLLINRLAEPEACRKRKINGP